MAKQKALYERVPFSARTSPSVLAYVEALRQTGLYGATQSEVIDFLLSTAVQARCAPAVAVQPGVLDEIKTRAMERKKADDAKKRAKKAAERSGLAPPE